MAYCRTCKRKNCHADCHGQRVATCETCAYTYQMNSARADLGNGFVNIMDANIYTSNISYSPPHTHTRARAHFYRHRSPTHVHSGESGDVHNRAAVRSRRGVVDCWVHDMVHLPSMQIVFWGVLDQAAEEKTSKAREETG